MQTFLVPVDFSPASHNAASYAAQLAKIFNAKLILFHVYMLPTPVSEVPYVMVTVDDMQKENEELIRKEADQLHSTYGVEIEWLVRIGIASDEVKALTNERSIDLVIMGMKGAGGIEKIIGSTTTNVIRKVKIPVWIVPHDASYKNITAINYASDFTYKTSIHLFDPLLILARKFNAKITILHVQLPNSSASIDELTGKKDLLKLFENIDLNFVTIKASSVTQGINKYIQETGSELLVMVAHKHSFFERIFSKDHTAAMAYESHIPLMILQDKG